MLFLNDVVFELLLINLVHVFHCHFVDLLLSIQVIDLLKVELIPVLRHVNNV